jgi:two-component system heavy metal sensor histidine kinase CusS
VASSDPAGPRGFGNTLLGFTSLISHELKQPLASMRMVLELALIKPREAERYRETIEQALEQTDRLVRLVDDLRDYAEAETQSADVADLGAELENLASWWRSLAEACEVRLETSFRGLKARGSREKISSALLKIGNYLVEQTRGGSVSMRSESGDGNRLSFACTGAAISAADLRYQFELFSGITIDRHRRAEVQLAAAHRILEACGGTTEVESNGSDLGVTITFVLET